MKLLYRHALQTAIVIGIAVFGFGWVSGPAGTPGEENVVRPYQTFNLPESIKRGKEAYVTECQNCHMENGEGLAGVYPPLAKADYLKKPVNHLIDVILKGLEGEIVVNGVKYNTPMPPQAYISDEKTADILNYIRNSWGNKASAVTPAMVKAQRARK
jgi:nitrite reductase (NO-forming)